MPGHERAPGGEGDPERNHHNGTPGRRSPFDTPREPPDELGKLAVRKALERQRAAEAGGRLVVAREARVERSPPADRKPEPARREDSRPREDPDR